MVTKVGNEREEVMTNIEMKKNYKRYYEQFHTNTLNNLEEEFLFWGVTEEVS